MGLKSFILSTLIIWCSATGFTQNKYQHQRAKDRFYKMTDSISNPDSVLNYSVTCWSCVGKQKEKFIESIQKINKFPNMQSLRVEGGRTDINLDSLAVPVDKLSHLKEITFYGYDLKAIPGWILK